MQVRELREYCERRGWRVGYEYIDEGISGAKESRPELNKLLADAHLRRFDAVVCWRFDRFARSVSHLLRALETFKALGIEFVSLSEQVDTSTPAGKLVFTVLGAVAELERSLIAERVRAGLRNARAKGKILGRPNVLWMPFRDDKLSRPKWFYRKAWNFYSKAIKQPNSKIFVMCRVGICRSASLTYFLLRTSGVSPQRAESTVVRARSAASICKAYREGGEAWVRRQALNGVRLVQR